MSNGINRIATNSRGKIRLPILIVSLLIIVFFIVSAAYTLQGVAPLPDIIGGTHATTTPSGTATSTKPVKVPDDVAPPVTSVADIGHAFGIAAGSGLAKQSKKDLDAQLDQMVAAGITWVRFDIEWGLVQYGSPDKSDWTQFDMVVDALNAHHLKGLGILLFTPQWARDPKCTGGAKCPPKDPATFAKFAAQAASRYKSKGVHAWEVWNEPNSYDFWATKTDCAAYTRLLKATYPALKLADPDAFVITGGVAPAATDFNNISQRDFVACIYKNGGKNYFDAIGDHPYTFPALPSAHDSNTWGQMSKTVPSIRSIMIANGDEDKRIWMTEFGTPTNGPDSKWFTSEAKQAEMVADTLKIYKTYDWAGPIFWYSLKDAGTQPTTIENFFGLVRNNGTPKPAYYVLKDLLSKGI